MIAPRNHAFIMEVLGLNKIYVHVSKGPLKKMLNQQLFKMYLHVFDPLLSLRIDWFIFIIFEAI